MKDEFLPTEGAPLVLDIQLRDPQGRLVRHIHRPAESYLYNFMRLIHSGLRRGQGGSWQATGTSGKMRGIGPNAPSTGGIAGPNVTPGAGSFTGLVVGGGTNTLFGTDFKLGSFIRPGTLANNLNYGKGTASETISAGTATMRHYRVFTNNSGSAVQVREAGYLRTGVHLLIRDLVGGVGIRVGTLASLTVSYNMRTVR